MPEPGSYKMPMVELGDVVLWYPHGSTSQEPYAALVSKVGHETLNVHLLDPSLLNLQIKDGVRHVSDPRARQPELIEQGGWDYTPARKRLLALELHLAKEGGAAPPRK